MKSTKKERRTPMGKADAKASNALIYVIGGGIIASVTGLSIAATHTAVNAMNRQSESQIAATQQAAYDALNPTPVPTPEPVPTPTPTPQSVSTPEPAVTQIPSVTPAPGDLPVTPVNPEVNPEPTPIPTPAPSESTTPPASTENPDVKWWFDENGRLLDGLLLDNDGLPYVVVHGDDWLSKIGLRYDFDYLILAELSNIPDPDVIEEGQIVRFPRYRTDDNGYHQWPYGTKKRPGSSGAGLG